MDDSGTWRRFVSSLVEKEPDWHVVCEASDGLEATQRAEELKPDLILLDISLPKLNGIEAARQIRKLAPNSKILFLSAYHYLDMAVEALNTGASGYVVKAHAGNELLTAMEAIIQGKSFVSRSLKGYNFTAIPGVKAPHCHEVLFYSDEAVLLDGFARFITVALRADGVAIALTTKPHQDNLVQTLRVRGLDIDAAIKTGRYISIDVAEMLRGVTVNGSADPVSYLKALRGFVGAATGASAEEHPRIALCGEGTSLLLADGKVDVAIHFEQLCTELATKHEVDVLCGFPLECFRNDEDNHVFQSICAEHSAVHSRSV